MEANWKWLRCQSLSLWQCWSQAMEKERTGVVCWAKMTPSSSWLKATFTAPLVLISGVSLAGFCCLCSPWWPYLPTFTPEQQQNTCKKQEELYDDTAMCRALADQQHVNAAFFCVLKWWEKWSKVVSHSIIFWPPLRHYDEIGVTCFTVKWSTPGPGGKKCIESSHGVFQIVSRVKFFRKKKLFMKK